MPAEVVSLVSRARKGGREKGAGTLCLPPLETRWFGISRAWMLTARFRFQSWVSYLTL